MSGSGLWASPQLLAGPTVALTSPAGVRIVDGAYVDDWWGLRIKLGNRGVLPAPTPCTLALSWFDIDPGTGTEIPMGRTQFDVDPATGFLHVAIPHRGPYLRAILASIGGFAPSQIYGVSLWNTNRREAPGRLIDSDPALGGATALTNYLARYIAVAPAGGAPQLTPIPAYVGRAHVQYATDAAAGELVIAAIDAVTYTGLVFADVLQLFRSVPPGGAGGVEAALPGYINRIRVQNFAAVGRTVAVTVVAHPDGNL